MSAHVPASEIETIVGATRHQTQHVIRGNYIDGTAYLLHSHECLARYRDLRDCPWSLALDRGEAWLPDDRPHYVRLRDGRLAVDLSPITTRKDAP